MKRLVKRSLVLVILAGMVLVADSTAMGDVPDEWKSLDVAGLTKLAQQFRAKGAAGVDDCKALAAYVGQRYAVDASAGKVDWGKWSGLAVALGSYYPDQTRTVMGQDIRKALAPDNEAIGKLALGGMMNVAKVLGSLGDDDAAHSICVTWTTVSDKYKSLTPSQLTSLARSLVPAGDAGKAARQRLINHVAAKYLASPEAVRSVICSDWRNFAAFLGGDLSDEARATWISGLKNAFGEADIKTSDVLSITDAMYRLGEQDRSGFVASWMSRSEAWKSCKVRELTSLAGSLRGDDESAKAARKTLAEHVAGKYLSSAEAVRSISCSRWSSLILYLGNDLSDEAKATWVSKIREGFSQDEMETRDVVYLAGGLRGLGDEKAAGFVASWVSRSESWKTCKISELVSLARGLGGDDEAVKAARKTLGDHIKSKYLADAAATRSVGCRYWRELARRLGGDLSAEDRQLWQGKIREAFAESDLNLREVFDLVEGMRSLGDKNTAGFIASWMARTESWKSYKASELMLLASRLSGDDDALKSARKSLVEHIAGKYLAGHEAVRSVSCSTWYSFAAHLGKDLSSEARAAWISKLRAAFAQSELKAREVMNLIHTLSRLGDQETSIFLASWVVRSASWKSYKPGELVAVAQRLRGDDEAVKAARKRLAEHVVADYLTDNTRIRSVGCSNWKALSLHLRLALSAEERLAWAGKLCSAFIDPQVLSELKARDMNNLTQALSCLDCGQAARLVSEWFKNYKDWAKSPIGELVSTGVLTARNDQADRKQIMARLEEVWLARSGELSWRQCVSVGYAWFSVPDESKARQWVMRGYESAVGTEQARAAVDARGINSLGSALFYVGLTGKDKGYPEFVAVLARLAGEGKVVDADWSWWKLWYCVAPLGTAQARRTLQAELADAEGNPWLMVTKILAMAYRGAGELKAWQTFLDGKIATAGMAGDTKARWLLARAFAESVVSSAEPSPLRGKKWLDRALATAESASCRLDVLRKLVDGYATIGRHDTGLQVLDSMAGQFAGTDEAAGIETLREEIREAKVQYIAGRVRRKAEHRRRVTEAWKSELQKRLAEAQQRGDQEAILRLQRMLGQQ